MVKLLASLVLSLMFSMPAQSKPVGVNLAPSGFSSFSWQGPVLSGLLEADANRLKLSTLRHSDWPWDIQAWAPTTAAVKTGDRILASFKVRALESSQASGEVLFYLGFDGANSPFTKSVDWAGRAGKTWKQVEVPFEAAADAGASEAKISFKVGFPPQKMEIKDLRVMNYGQTVSLEKLPRTAQSWPGREAGAAWRKEANKRILQIRTAALSVKVVDASGKPVTNAKVRIRQVKSAFRFGTSVSSKLLFRGKPGPDLERYKQTIPQYFNIITEENSLKWKSLAGDLGPDFSLEQALKCSAMAEELGLDFRGHTLLWPSWKNSPKLAENLKGKPAALRKAILKNVSETVAAMKGKVVDWDVVNEPWDNHDVMDVLGGDGILTECYQLAHQVDPGARLFINDYAILEGGGGQTNHRDRYEKVIQGLLDAGVALDGIGIQGHFGQPLTAPVDMKATLDRYAKFGKKLLITEYDVEEADPAVAGDFLRDLLTLCYSHPAVEGFIMWGFWDGKHWHKNAPLFNKDWSPKPALKVWEELVMKEWKTDVRAKSGKDGRVRVPAHLGDYEITVETKAGPVTRQAKLDKGGMDLTVELPK